MQNEDKQIWAFGGASHQNLTFLYCSYGFSHR
jgi:hypothetical protein